MPDSQKTSSKKSFYFIGIGGIGMSAVAGIAAARGYDVAGSDADDVYDPSLSVLHRSAIPFAVGYRRENIAAAFGGRPDAVVATSAVGDENPELSYAKEQGLRIISFPEALEEVASGMREIVVIGTHGKSTTTGLIGHMLQALHGASFLVGAVLNNYQSNFNAGSGPDMVIEGDEYVASASDSRPKFMLYRPDILVVNNLEFDHPDAYHDLQAMKDAFALRVSTLPESATLVFNADDQTVCEIMKDAKCKLLSFGFSSGMIRGGRSVLRSDGMFEFTVTLPENFGAGRKFSLVSRFPGEAYAYNFLAATAAVLAAYPETDLEQLQELAASYTGVKRRFEAISEGDPYIIDDYAHHATAVRKTLEAARLKFPHRRIVCFFEPHTYSRTKETLPELAEAFGAADVTYIAEIYPAREKKLASSITGAEVLEAVRAFTPNAQYVADAADALRQYAAAAKPGDVVIVMAVGAFNRLAYNIRDEISFRR